MRGDPGYYNILLSVLRYTGEESQCLTVKSNSEVQLLGWEPSLVVQLALPSQISGQCEAPSYNCRSVRGENSQADDGLAGLK